MDIFLILLVLFLTVTAKPIQYDVQDDSLGEIQDDNGNYETQLEGDANQLDPTTSNPSTNTPELVANGDSEPFDSTQSCQPSPVQKLRKKRDVTDTMNDNTLSDSNYCRSDFFTGRPVNGENHPIRIIKKKTDNFVRMQKPTACCDLIPKQVIDGRVNWGRCIKFDSRDPMCKPKNQKFNCKTIHFGYSFNFKQEIIDSHDPKSGWGEDCTPTFKDDGSSNSGNGGQAGSWGDK